MATEGQFFPIETTEVIVRTCAVCGDGLRVEFNGCSEWLFHYWANAAGAKCCSEECASISPMEMC